MSIYIVSHLRLKRPFDKDFRVIYVGPMSGPTSPDDFAVTDAIQAPHIAGKNKTFCELTALYQMLNLHAASKDELIAGLDKTTWRNYIVNMFLWSNHYHFIGADVTYYWQIQILL